jgi:transcriptional regulator with GAF, ATPase, and Fis domain
LILGDNGLSGSERTTKKTRFTEERMVKILREADKSPVSEVAKKHAVMPRKTRVTFAMCDLDRLKCTQAVVDGDLKLVRASERLGLTTRQIRRLARRYAAGGPVRVEKDPNADIST